MKKDVIIIAGPTASGKTSVGIELAKICNGEIISADSMQIYKHMNIGTATPTIEEQENIIHHNFDIINPDEEFSVAKYKSITTDLIEDILTRGKIPIIVGGTGLYIDALLYNIDFSNSKFDPKVRKKYEDLLINKGKEYLYDLLITRDQNAKDSVHMNNSKRVIRSLEILEENEGTLAEYKANAVKNESIYNFKLFVLNPKRDLVYKRIEDRIDIMIEEGLINEVNDLLNRGYSHNLVSMQAIGYKEIVWYIKGKINYEEMVRLLKRNTRRFAKRQFTWFRKYKNAEFIDITNSSSANKIAINLI